MLRFIPAGIYRKNFYLSGYSIYVRLLPAHKWRSDISIDGMKGHEGGHVNVVKLYDRDVYIISNLAHVPDLDFDFHYNLSMYGHDSIFRDRFGVEEVLISANCGQHEFKHATTARWRPRNGIRVVADSGGSQLKAGSIDYIDPKVVIDWISNMADVGMALDIPPMPVDTGNRQVMFGLAEAQRRNNQLYVSHGRSDLQFMNVVHGATLDQARRWCEHVHTDDKRFIGWAVGPDNMRSWFANIQSLLVPILEFGGGQRFHMFGASGKTLLPLFAWVSKSVPVLTVDSTKYLVGIRFREYMVRDIDGLTSQINVGHKTPLPPKTVLPCSCPVCHAFKWADAFRLGSRDGGDKNPRCAIPFVLGTHNAFQLLEGARWWSDLASKSSLEEYQYAIKAAFGPKRSRSFFMILDYIEQALSEGLDKAHRAWLPYMGTATTPHNMRRLFGGKQSSYAQYVLATDKTHRESQMSKLVRYLPEAELTRLWKEYKRKDEECLTK